jgi:hypothetical protein
MLGEPLLYITASSAPGVHPNPFPQKQKAPAHRQGLDTLFYVLKYTTLLIIINSNLPILPKIIHAYFFPSLFLSP